jgi:hypothetical protein
MKTKQIRFIEAVRIEARLRDRATFKQWSGYAVMLAQGIDPETIPSEPENAAKRFTTLFYQLRILPMF